MVLFVFQNETCFIDNHCVVENEMSLTGCEACQSSTAVYSWSGRNNTNYVQVPNYAKPHVCEVNLI